MAITFGNLTLPDGLAWSDEFAWSATAQATDYSLTGALIVEVSTRQAGRPITLIGQSSGRAHTAWITRADLLTLRALLETAGAEHTLTLHDARTFSVIARHDGAGPLEAEPLPKVASFLPANPDDDDWYVLKALRLLEV